MHTILFWKKWTSSYQRFFWVCAVFFMLAMGFLWSSYAVSPGPVFTAQKFQELEAEEIPVHVFNLGSTQVTVSTENYLLFEHVLGSALQPNLPGAWLFLCLLMTGIIVLLTVLSTLPRFWFYLGMGLFILFLVSLRIEALSLFGMTNKVPPAAILLLFGIAGYYFQFLGSSSSFALRLGVFLGITAVTGVVIVFAAHINQPFYLLSANGLFAGVILSVLFIFTVAHEILATFITILTSGSKPTKSLRHFMVASAIYLLNLGLLYADKKHIIAWHFFPSSVFVLLSLSAILGVWGFRQRENLYENMMRADPFGTYFILALAGISLGTVGYLLATANDPAIQFLQDVTLYGHIGYGIIFLVYIIVNFISLLGNNMPVYKVLYKPVSMPYFTFRLAGLIATFAFFAYSNYQVSINQVYAGYHNALGDYYFSQDTLLPAESYYQRSLLYATRNYHAHYAVAELHASRWEFEKEKEELKKLAMGRPLDLAYLNYSRLFELSGAWPDAIGVLKSGLQDFPKNGLLQNALGLVYAKAEEADSAVMMFNAARNSSSSRKEAETNLMGLSARLLVTPPVDSLMIALGSDNPGVKGNALALASRQKRILDVSLDPGADTVLNAFSAAELNNYLINHVSHSDTSFVSKVVSLARRPSNISFRNLLLSSAAHCYYESGEMTRAFKLMHEIAFLTQQPKYYNVLGLWSLEQGASAQSIHYFDQSLLKNYRDAFSNRALALTESNDLNQAGTAWDSLLKSKNTSQQKEAARMKNLLTATQQAALALDDMGKLDYARYRFSLQQQDDFEKWISSISDPEIRARAVVHRARILEEADEPERAIATLVLAKGLKFSDRKLLEAGQHINLRCLARQKRWPQLDKLLHSGITFDGNYQQEKVYFEALLGEQAGKKEDEKFQWLGSVNPFFEDAVVQAARYAGENSTDRLKAYSILANALESNPHSVKLLKAYFVQAARLDFDEPAKESLDKLHTLLSREAFIQFARENADIFEISRN